MDLIFVLIAGLLIGSFINALVWRIPQGITMGGRSACVSCGHALAWLDLIPLASFVMLGFRCRYCRAPISWRYPLIEILTASLFAFTWYQMPEPHTAIALLWYGLIVSGLITLFFIDYYYRIVPDSITIPVIVIAIILQIARGTSMLSLFEGVLIAGGFFALQYAVSRGRWIGNGDIRLGILMGVALGWPQTLAALFIAYVAGALWSVLLLGLGRARMDSATPFGTYLTLATYATLLYGMSLIEWYMHLWTRI